MAKSKFSAKALIFPLLLIIIIIAVVLFLVERHHEEVYGQIGTVNGVPISARLFSSKLNEERSKEKALDDCVRIVVQQDLARKYGIIDDISYEKIIKDCEQENKKRKQDLANGKAVYGPVEYSPDNYFVYVFSNMVIKLKTKLGEEEFKLDDSTLKQMYDSQKDSLYKLVSIKISRISLPVTDKIGNADPVKKAEAKAKIDEITNRIKAGEKFEDLAKTVNQDRTAMEQVFDSGTVREDYRNNPELRELAEKMSANQISDIVELEGSLNLIKCEEYKVEGYKKFEDVKENIKLRYIDTKYEEYIDQLIKDAKLDIDTKAYGSLSLSHEFPLISCLISIDTVCRQI